MKSKNLSYTLILLLVFFGFLLGGLIFYGILNLNRVPIWWVGNQVTTNLHPPNTPFLRIEVSPETPLDIGEEITAKVTNSSNGLPVQGAEITITKDSFSRNVTTNADGIATFEYPGEVTIIDAQMEGIWPSRYVVIPKIPTPWVWGMILAIIGWVVSPIVAGLLGYFLPRLIDWWKNRNPPPLD